VSAQRRCPLTPVTTKLPEDFRARAPVVLATAPLARRPTSVREPEGRGHLNGAPVGDHRVGAREQRRRDGEAGCLVFAIALIRFVVFGTNRLCG
jgi:hypothetical protein